MPSTTSKSSTTEQTAKTSFDFVAQMAQARIYFCFWSCGDVGGVDMGLAAAASAVSTWGQRFVVPLDVRIEVQTKIDHADSTYRHSSSNGA